MSKVTYRGFDKTEVLDSIRKAGDFLDRHRIGPHTDKMIDELCDEAALAALERTRKGGTFARAMEDTGYRSQIMLFRLFNYHARANTDGVGKQVLEKLARWGAFSGRRTQNESVEKKDVQAQSYLASDREIDSWVIVQYLKMLLRGDRNFEGDRGRKDLKRPLAIFNRKSAYLADLKEFVLDLADMIVGGKEDEARQSVSSLEPNQIYDILRAAEKKLNVEKTDGHINYSNPFKRYVAIVPCMQRLERSEESSALKETVKTLLRTNGCGGFGVGLASVVPQNDDAPKGILFTATPETARQIAEETKLEVVEFLTGEPLGSAVSGNLTATIPCSRIELTVNT